MKTMTIVRPTWSARLEGADRQSALLVGFGLLAPLLAVLEPVQPLRALAACAVLMVLPGLALARLLRLRDPVLVCVVAVAASLAATVLVSTALFYAGLWSWQLSLGLIGALTAAIAATSALARTAS